jgi:hypothetical protein
MSRKVAVVLYIEPDQKSELDELSHRTRVPMSAYLREGIADVLCKYRTPSKSVSKRLVVQKEKDPEGN